MNPHNCWRRESERGGAGFGASTGLGLIASMSCMVLGPSSRQGQVATVPFSFVVASSACAAPEGADGAYFLASLTPERTSLSSKGSSMGLCGSAAVVNSTGSSGGAEWG